MSTDFLYAGTFLMVITPMDVHVRKEIRLSAGHQWHPEDAAVSPGCQWRPEDTVSPGYRGILRIPCPEDLQSWKWYLVGSIGSAMRA